MGQVEDFDLKNKKMKLDILVFAAHPDDAELACAGTIYSHVLQGKKVGIVDLTAGELGTRGTPEIRRKEAEASAKILNLSVRENLNFKDGFFKNDEAHQLEVAKYIRKYQPEIILANAVSDRHPDHGRAAQLVTEANFVAGLRMVETTSEGSIQEPWRAGAVYHYIQSNFIQPDFIVDVSSAWDVKLQAIRAFKSQFFNAETDVDEPTTFISTPEFMEFIIARGKEYGHSIGAAYGEGFTVEKNIGVKSLFNLQ